jgi:hypothetical protein
MNHIQVVKIFKIFYKLGDSFKAVLPFVHILYYDSWFHASTVRQYDSEWISKRRNPGTLQDDFEVRLQKESKKTFNLPTNIENRVITLDTTLMHQQKWMIFHHLTKGDQHWKFGEVGIFTNF